MPVAGITVEVSEATYRAWWHRALRIPVAPDFTEPIDEQLVESRVYDVDEYGWLHDTQLAVHGMAFEYD